MYIGLREKNGALGLADVRREIPRDFNEAALSPSLTKGSNAALQKGSATYNLWRHSSALLPIGGKYSRSVTKSYD